ncbi:DUF7504 family protein [Halomarina ordinaria]|uniref:Uncharacterized protein n=1 Tax=Halomarina ordinaria TaxID=3033939 RepID=A0ABD5U5Q8_9EURY|nr:hypothetical protein [Halomarina sp. PSRA2]
MTAEFGAGAFAQALAGLKRRGSSLLVVGATCGRSHLSACRRLLGEDDEGPRRRVVVLTDGVANLDDRVPETGQGDDTLTVFDRRPATRSAAAATVPSEGLPTTLGALERDVVDAIETFDRAAEGLAPAELRVCVDSLRPLVEGYDEADVESFVEGITAATVEHGGMCHVHLPVGRDSETVERLEPYFAATIELRELHVPRTLADDSPHVTTEQRWHLHDEELSTDWLPL